MIKLYKQIILSCIALVFTAGPLFSQNIYYSRNRGGNWSDRSSWTFNPSGAGVRTPSAPGREDEVVILSGSTITIDDDDANGERGVSPRSLGFRGFPSDNQRAFYQIGNITIREGGRLISPDESVMISGILTINNGGTMEVDGDLIVLNQLLVMETANFEIDDDLILLDNSQAIINNSAEIGDDIYFYNNDVILCGQGEIQIKGEIQQFNQADASQQVCDSFPIICDGNCGMGTGSSFMGSGQAPLPVELLHFEGVSSEGNIYLDWTTAWEENFDFFTIERAGTDRVFKAIGEVKGKGNSTAEVAYSFTDNSPLNGQAFYRLKATDFDGSVEYHRIISVYHDSLVQPEFSVYPNPVTHRQINFNANHLKLAEIRIVDITGRVVFFRQVTEQIRQLSLPSFIRPGTYLLVASGTDGEKLQQKIMVL